MEPKNGDKKLLDKIPEDAALWIDGKIEHCRSTGYAIYFDGQWYNEYVDKNGILH